MSLRSQLKLDLSKWSQSAKLTQFTKQLNDYEKRVASFVKDFDVKSREARQRSRKQLDKFLGQVKKTRSEVEKKVTVLVNLEGKKLNKKINELFGYLKTIAQKEARSAGKSKATGKGTRRRSTTKSTRKSGTRKRSRSSTTA